MHPSGSSKEIMTQLDSTQTKRLEMLHRRSTIPIMKKDLILPVSSSSMHQDRVQINIQYSVGLFSYIWKRTPTKTVAKDCRHFATSASVLKDSDVPASLARRVRLTWNRLPQKCLMRRSSHNIQAPPQDLSCSLKLVVSLVIAPTPLSLDRLSNLAMAFGNNLPMLEHSSQCHFRWNRVRRTVHNRRTRIR